MSSENLPVVADDGFGGDDDGADRLIQGAILACVDGVWSCRDGTPIPENMRLVAPSTTSALQRWEDERPVEIIRKQPGKPLPDLDEKNAEIPEDEWEQGLNGEPRPPWQHVHVVYLLDPRDASVYTYVNGTVGARIAVEKLKDKVKWMRALRGSNVCPIVELAARAMKTKFGVKRRPEFQVVEWRDFGGPAAIAVSSSTPQIGKPVAEPTSKEIFDDSLPF
jgi:hypothetical protein